MCGAGANEGDGDVMGRDARVTRIVRVKRIGWRAGAMRAGAVADCHILIYSYNVI